MSRTSLRIGAGTVVALALVAISSLPASAQRPDLAPVAAAPPLGLAEPSAPASKRPADFALKALVFGIDEKVADFKRLIEHEQWEEAFQTLDALSAKQGAGFIDRGDGVLIPARSLTRGLLATLPGAGREAYRLFRDPAATALWDKAKGAGEADALAAIVDSYVITSVGDRAADRLGDLHFERGEMGQAIAAWRALLSCCPESEIPQAQTYLKIATALARGGSSGELDEVRQIVREQFAAQEVTFGGRKTTAAEALARLTTDDRRAPAAEIAELPDDISLPVSGEPLWRFSFQSTIEPVHNVSFQVRDVYGRQRSSDFAIPAAVDDQRLYVNVIGVEMAFDLATGKLLWRTGKLHELQMLQLQQGVSPERYSIAVHGNRVWSVTRAANDQNQQGGYALVVRDAATGKEIFSTRRSLSSWNILGPPCLTDDVFDATQPPGKEAQTEQAVFGETRSPAGFDFAQGFAASGDRITVNGNASLAEGRVRLTDGTSKQAGTAFLATPVNVQGFRTQFDFQLSKAFADGISFIVQSSGPKALGGNGQGLGYSGIPGSIGVKFDLYEDANTTGLFMNGARLRGEGSVALKPSKIDLTSGHVFRVEMSYDGTHLRVTLTDTQTQASHTQEYGVDIPAQVGGPTAYVGFGGSTGQMTAVQEILNWSYTPLSVITTVTPAAKTAYVGASPNGQGRELSLLVLNAENGKLLKTIALGNHAVDQNQIYAERAAEPSMLVHLDRLYLDTHGGALVSIVRRTGEIEWGLQYESPSPQPNYYYGATAPRRGVSGPLMAGGLLFAKGMRSSRLLGIQLDLPRLEWQRPVSKSAVIVAADHERIYLGGEELTAYNLETQLLEWAAQLPHSADWSQPLVTKSRLYQFTSRGICVVDKETGNVLEIFRGADTNSLGGSLLVTPQVLLTVSNSGITAYAR
jgi:outer membrane protein assembly factor BamB